MAFLVRGSKYRWGLLALTGLGVFLRWFRPLLVEYSFDEALVSRLSLLIAYWDYRPLVGVQASIGPYQFPLFLYIAALAVRVWPSPLAIVYWIALLNALAIPVAYVLGKRYWGTKVGLLAAFLFAVNAWSVAYARKIWTQNITLVTVMFFLMVFLAFVDRKPWALVGAWGGVAALIGLHLEGMAFLVLLVLVIFLWRKDVRPAPLLAGVVLFALLLSPYFYHDAQQGWRNLRAFVLYGQSPAIVTFHAVDFAFRLASGRALHSLGGYRASDLKDVLPPGLFLPYLFEGLLVVSMLYAGWRAWRGPLRERRAYTLLLLWFWLPILLQIRHTRPVFPHYFTILYPSAFLLVSAFLFHGLSTGRWTRGVQRVGLAFLFLWGLWQVVAFQRVLSFVDAHPTPGGFGVPFKYFYQAAEEAKRLAAGKDVLVIARDAGQEWSVSFLQFDALLFTYPQRRFVNGQNTVVIPQKPVVFLIVPDEAGSNHVATFLRRFPEVQHLQEIARPDGATFVLAWKGDRRPDLPPEFVRFPELIHMENGVVLEGYRVWRAPQALDVWIAWRIPRPLSGRYHLFVHVLDEKGQMVGQGDVSAVLPYYQRAGDLVCTHLIIPLQQRGRVFVHTGMYEYPSLKRVSIVKPRHFLAKDLVTLGSFVVP